eukprot:TRINITY_DN4439_c0_g1_i1.p1 TRINITY_DN4439_c0_g1~~TRINITY_DN4439_c0_g1_i1.p1  ORF type:complete len:401 (-),score=65.98 TRINITY_DN4439_c0_g1_i1:357-1559(-)
MTQPAAGSRQRTAVVTAMAVLTAAALAAVCARMLQQRRRSKQVARLERSAAAAAAAVASTNDQPEPVAGQADEPADGPPCTWAWLTPRYQVDRSCVCDFCHRNVFATGGRSPLAVIPNCCSTPICNGCLADARKKAISEGMQLRCCSCKRRLGEELLTQILDAQVGSVRGSPFDGARETVFWLSDRGLCDSEVAEEELHRLLWATSFDPVVLYQYLHQRMLMACFDPRLHVPTEAKKKLVSDDCIRADLVAKREDLWGQLRGCIGESELHSDLVSKHEKSSKELWQLHDNAIEGIIAELGDNNFSGPCVDIPGFKDIVQVDLSGLSCETALQAINECVVPCLPHVGRVVVIVGGDDTGGYGIFKLIGKVFGSRSSTIMDALTTIPRQLISAQQGTILLTA